MARKYFTTSKMGDTVEVDSTLANWLVKSGKKRPEDFEIEDDADLGKIGTLQRDTAAPENIESRTTYTAGTPSGRKAKVVSYTVPGSLQEASVEGLADAYATGQNDVSLGRALMPRSSMVMDMMDADRSQNYQMPGAAVDIRKPEYNQREAMLTNAPRLGWNAFKDVASLPGRMISLHPDYAPVEYQHRGPLHQLAMTGASGAAGVARSPELPVLFASGVGPETALGRALASTAAGVAMPSLDRATDYSEETSAMPTGREFALQAALGFVPEIGSFARSAGHGLKEGTRELFMQQVKPLPGKNNRQVWEAVDEFSKDPELVKEVTKGSKTMRDVADAFYRGEMDRAAQVDPIYAAMEAEGARVQVRLMLSRALDAITGDVNLASATPAERIAAYDELRTLLTQPEGRYLKEEIEGGMGPFPMTTELSPLQARNVKSDLYGRVDWSEAGKAAKSEGAKGAAASAREQLEALDKTGTLAEKNREWGKFLAAEEGFRRMESRAMNKNRPTALNPFSWVKIAKEDPRTVYYGTALAQALEGVSPYGVYLSPGLAGLKSSEAMEARR